MDTTKTAVQVTQELLALVNARLDHQQGRGNKESDPEADPIVQALLDEISLSGDAAQASVDRSDPYFASDHHDPELFRKAVSRLRSEAGEIPNSLQKLFDKLLQ